MKFNFDNTYSSLPNTLWSRVSPIPVRSPRLVAFNEALETELGIGTDLDDQGVTILAGNSLAEGSAPIAQAYAGHQYGHYVRLGDGRAHLLGEHVTFDGHRFDIQLKGSGQTPYSRRGDGRAALGPMLREYVLGEFMHAMGIPTTRGLAVVLTGESVYRESEFQGAILTRVAQSHIRVGTFELAAKMGDLETLRTLADYSIRRHYPDLEHHDYLEFLGAVCERQGRLIAQWMLVGFIHGVMNTDNMAISGETIDYGPCAFMDAYNPLTVFSSIDHQGRYAFSRQPQIGLWNLMRLAESLLPLLPGVDHSKVEATLDRFKTSFEATWVEGLNRKLGFAQNTMGHTELIERLMRWMQKTEADFNGSFRALSKSQNPGGDEEFGKWHTEWLDGLRLSGRSHAEARAQMLNINPAVIPRNHAVEQALTAAELGDFKPFENLVAAVREPFVDRPEHEPLKRGPQPGEKVEQTFCGT